MPCRAARPRRASPPATLADRPGGVTWPSPPSLPHPPRHPPRGGEPSRPRRPDAADPRDPRPARPERLGARAGRPDARRPRRARAVPVEQDPGLQRSADRAPADARGPRLLARPARRLHHPARGRHVGRPRHRAHRARAPEPGRHRGPPRQDPGGRPGRPVQRASSSTARSRSGSRRAGSRSAWSTTSSHPTTRSFFDFAPELERLIRLAERQAFGPSTQALIDEAVCRDIPFIRLDRHSLVQLGQGLHQQRIRATMTSRTSAIGVDIASDKSLTNQLLDSAGLPVPALAGRRDAEDDAVAAARRLGFPCVRQAARRQPRPRRPPRPARRGGRAQRRSPPRCARAAAATSSSRPTSPATTTACSSSAARWRRSPSACRRRVIGDGKHTVRQLVDIENTDPRRGIGHEKVLTRIKVDEAAEELVRAAGLRARRRAADGTAGQARR